MIRVLIGLIALALMVVFVQANLPKPETKSLQGEPQKLIRLLEDANQYTQMFYAGDFETLIEKFSEPMRLLMPLGDLQNLRDRIAQDLGEEIEVVNESLTPQDQGFLYDRIALFSNYEGHVQIQITIDANEQIVGFTIQPIKESNYGGAA